jgi:hypothetical protein
MSPSTPAAEQRPRQVVVISDSPAGAVSPFDFRVASAFADAADVWPWPSVAKPRTEPAGTCLLDRGFAQALNPGHTGVILHHFSNPNSER